MGACVGNKANPSPRFDDAEAIQKIILPRNLTTGLKRGVLKARDLSLKKTVQFGTVDGRYFVVGGEAGAAGGGTALPDVEGVAAAAA